MTDFFDPDRARRGRRRTRRSIADLPREQQLAKARDIVYRQLGDMDRSRAELDGALKRREVPEDVREEILAKFVRADLVNDERFARSFVHMHISRTSRRALRQKLARKGVERGIIEAALEEVEPEAEFDAAVSIAEKKLRIASGNPDTLERRTFAALARRGFAPALVSAALRQARENLERGDSGMTGGWA